MPEIPLLELEQLHIVRSRATEKTILLRNVSLTLFKGESLGLVGESGSGKSLTALASMNLLPEAEMQFEQGHIRFLGQDLRTLDGNAMNSLRGSRLSIIFQDALASLNPVRRVRSQLTEVFRFHGRPLAMDQVSSCLQKCGLSEISRVLHSYPHELSGGMRQRLMLAMALLLDPELLIADEPTTALDLTLQARWVELVQRLRREQQLGLLFISHDLALVAELCERVAVLYRGHLLENSRTHDLLREPLHPYTQAMIQALPRRGQSLKPIMTKPYPSPNACPYARDCPRVMPLCHEKIPELKPIGDRWIACHAFHN